MPEGVLLTGILLGRFAGGLYLIHPNRDAERWVGFLPDFRIRPIICFMKTIHNNLNLQKSPNDGKIYK